MSVNVGHLFKKRTVKDTAGNIIDMLDETNGGWIIRKRQIVNPERFAEIQKVEEDRRLAAQAVAHAVTVNAPEREATSGRIDTIEKKVDEMEGYIKTILKLLQNERDNK